MSNEFLSTVRLYMTKRDMELDMYYTSYCVSFGNACDIANRAAEAGKWARHTTSSGNLFISEPKGV